MDIARSRRAEEIKILRLRSEYAERHLDDGMFLGLGSDVDRMMMAQRDAKAQSIKDYDKQIAELESLDDDALVERFCPGPRPELKAAMEQGLTLTDTLLRGRCL